MQGKTLRKTNTLWSAAKKEDFFSANRRFGLDGWGIVQKFATQKAWMQTMVSNRKGNIFTKK